VPASSADPYAARRATFRHLHESVCFVIPNPWDIGTARYLRHLGFQALATTSAGFAFTRGLPDADWAVPRETMLAHIAEIVAATELPVNADYEAGYAHDPEGVAESVRLCVQTGVAGLSIEDATGDRANPLYDLKLAVERITAARRVIDASGADVMLTARAECYLVGHPDPLQESIRRLEAYAEAGADVLYAPGPRTADDIRAIVQAVAPRPVNVIVSNPIGLTVEQVADLGVRRISLGSGLVRAAWGAFMRSAEALAQGRFDPLGDSRPFAEINGFFRDDLKARS
jgi:2-methylisocitrate lyase-like PEP mutase family enzyme